MRIPRVSRYALSSCVAAAMLSGCGGSQPPIVIAPGAVPQSAAIPRAAHSRSWMAPEAQSEDLIYVTHEYATDVSVYSYPTGMLVGSLSNPDNTIGDCVDKAGDVFIVNFDTPSEQPGNVVEYAHGGTTPIRTLTYPNAYFSGCAVDPTTGNLAVTVLEKQDIKRGGVVVYPDATGTPTEYSERHVVDYSFCGYDNNGNLYVDGDNLPNGTFQLLELPSGQKRLTDISLSRGLEGKLIPGSVQWDGANVVIGNGRTAHNGVHIRVYQIKLDGSTGKIAGKTLLRRAHSYRDFQFWIQGGTILSPYGVGDRATGDHVLGFWTYPQGHFIKLIRDKEGPWGVTVSLAQSRANQLRR